MADTRELLLGDRQLLAAFRAGTRDALSEVYRAYAPGLAATLARGMGFSRDGERFQLRGVRGAFELDDILQDTFMRAFTPQARERYDGLRPYHSYLAAIARNLLIDRYRQRGTLDRELRGAVSGPANPEELLADRRLRAIHDSFLASLDAHDRKLVELRFEQGLSRREVGEALGLSAMRLRWRERALRLSLAAAMSDTARDLGFAPELLALVFLVALSVLR